MIPPRTHPAWRTLISQEEHQNFKFLALKFLMNRLRGRLAMDDSPAALDTCVGELHAFAVKHERFVEADLKPVFEARRT